MRPLIQFLSDSDSDFDSEFHSRSECAQMRSDSGHACRAVDASKIDRYSSDGIPTYVSPIFATSRSLSIAERRISVFLRHLIVLVLSSIVSICRNVLSKRIFQTIIYCSIWHSSATYWSRIPYSRKVSYNQIGQSILSDQIFVAVQVFSSSAPHLRYIICTDFIQSSWANLYHLRLPSFVNYFSEHGCWKKIFRVLKWIRFSHVLSP